MARQSKAGKSVSTGEASACNVALLQHSARAATSEAASDITAQCSSWTTIEQGLFWP